MLLGTQHMMSPIPAQHDNCSYNYIAGFVEEVQNCVA